MSLSVCVRNVRATSQGGNITEGNMTCENIDILKSSGYTIEYLDGQPEPDSTASSFEPIQEIEQIETIIEELPIEAEIIQVVKPIYAIYQEDIFDRSLELVDEITQVKVNNITLTNENNNLQSQLENVFTQKDVNELKLEHEIKNVYSVLEGMKNYASQFSKPQYNIEWANYTKTLESREIELEKFATNLGLIYNRRKVVDKEPFYYKDYIPNWTFEKWEKLP